MTLSTFEPNMQAIGPRAVAILACEGMSVINRGNSFAVVTEYGVWKGVPLVQLPLGAIKRPQVLWDNHSLTDFEKPARY